MKLRHDEIDLDSIDIHILKILEENCKLQLAKVGEQVGLSAPAVIDRIKKLEDSGVIVDYRAILDARKLGKDVTAFVGVVIDHPKAFEAFEDQIGQFDEVLECHHVTGQHTMLLKVKTYDTAALENVIRRLRSIAGVTRTDTMVVLSTSTERTQVSLPHRLAPATRLGSGVGVNRRDCNGPKNVRKRAEP